MTYFHFTRAKFTRAKTTSRFVLLYAALAPACFLTPCLHAQTSTPNSTSAKADPAKTPAIDELFRLTKPESAIEHAKSSIVDAAGQSFDAQVKKFDDPKKYASDREQLLKQAGGIVDAKLNWAVLKPDFEKVYSDTFTKDELNGIVAFYKTPAGMAELQKLGGALYKCNVVAQQRLASIQPDLRTTFGNIVTSVKQKSDSAKAASGQKPSTSTQSPAQKSPSAPKP